MLLLLRLPAFATDYYLGSTAASQPGQTLSGIEALNARLLRPGDRVYFQGGETFHGSIQLDAREAGDPAQPVRITSFGNGRATINGGSESAVVIRNTGGVAVTDLNLAGAGKSATLASGIDAGVELPTSTRIASLQFERLRISGFHFGVEIWGSPSGSQRAWPGFRDVVLNELEVADNLGEGIRIWGSWYPDGDGANFSHANFRLTGCDVHDQNGDPETTVHTGSGIVLSGVDGALIEGCTVHDNGGLGPASGGGPFGILVFEARNCTVQGNLVYNQRTSSTSDGGGIDLDGGSADCLVQYNYTYGNDGPGLALIQFDDASPLVRNTVRFNISDDDCRANTQGAIYVGQFSITRGLDVAEIHSNSVFVSTNPRGQTPPAVKVEDLPQLTNVRLRNNLLVATHTGALITGATAKPAVALYQGNDYWGGKFDLTAFRRGGQETIPGRDVGLRVDPKVKSAAGAATRASQLGQMPAYQLPTASPVGRGGLALGALFGVPVGTRDFFGQPLVAGALPVGAVTFGAPALRIVNLSVRAVAGSGAETLIAGFVVDGAGSLPAVVRVIGPGLASRGLLDGTLLDPRLALYASDTLLAENDNWGGGASLADAFRQVGAFPLPVASADAALLQSLAAGRYTVHAASSAAERGVALIELFDVPRTGGTRLINVSARTRVESGSGVLIAGFVLEGQGRQKVLIRGVGPSLAHQGVAVADALGDPRLTLFREATAIASNDNWGGDAGLKAAFGAVGAFELASDISADAAMLVTLDAGIYTAHLNGTGASTGVGLLEVYEVP